MTKIEELEQKLNECQKELAELKESKKGNSDKWKPKEGEIYWFFNDLGNDNWCYWENDEVDNWRIKNMPLFKTDQECEKYRKFRDAVKEKSYEFTREEWKDESISKFYIYYSYQNGFLEIAPNWDCRDLDKTYFKTKEDAQYIIDNFKEELMEYWL